MGGALLFFLADNIALPRMERTANLSGGMGLTHARARWDGGRSHRASAPRAAAPPWAPRAGRRVAIAPAREGERKRERERERAEKVPHRIVVITEISYHCHQSGMHRHRPNITVFASSGWPTDLRGTGSSAALSCASPLAGEGREYVLGPQAGCASRHSLRCRVCSRQSSWPLALGDRSLFVLLVATVGRASKCKSTDLIYLNGNRRPPATAGPGSNNSGDGGEAAGRAPPSPSRRAGHMLPESSPA